MANEEHLRILKQGVDAWNQWRGEPSKEKPDLSGANLFGADLSGANLSHADLSRTFLNNAHLSRADLSHANLNDAHLFGVDLFGADLSEARLVHVDLSQANLSGANLRRADLRHAYLHSARLVHVDLSDANLSEARLVRVDLSEADLHSANLSRADLSEADLSGADLSDAYLRSANLSRADLSEADLSGAHLLSTILGYTNLTNTKGLDTCRHGGPSIIDHQTLTKSGPLPLAFFRGCGLPDLFIDHIPSLFLGNPIEFYSCFISYAKADQAFAERLHADLQEKGVRCWFAPEDIKIGDPVRVTVDTAIRLRDKLVLILSDTSIASDWVEYEVSQALQEEKRRKTPILFPLRIDEAVMQVEFGWAKRLREAHTPTGRHIGDFTAWKEHDAYQQAFARLLRDLKPENTPNPS